MKNIILKMMMLAGLVFSVVSCNIETERPFAGDLTIKVTGLPASVTAVALFCNLNEWEAEQVNGTGFVQEVIGGSVTFTPAVTPGLAGYKFSTQLQCQFVPLTDPATKLDSSWWNKAISGSSTYANAKNNLVYDFSSRGAANPMTLTLDVSSNESNILVQRVHYENYGQALTPTM